MDSLLSESYSNFNSDFFSVDTDRVSIWENLMAPKMKESYLNRNYIQPVSNNDRSIDILKKGNLNCGLWFSYLFRFIPQFIQNYSTIITYLKSQNNETKVLILPQLPILNFPETFTMPKNILFQNITKFHLISLKLSHLPMIFFQMNDLVELVLDSNCLSYFSLECCSNEFLTNLKILSLKNNWITEMPRNITKLINLEVLSIDENNITSLEPIQLNKFSKLITLNASSNKFMIFPSNFNSNSLENIDLSSNNFYSIPSFVFQKSTNLKKIIFSHNPLRVIPTSIQYLTQLDCLIAQECHVNVIIDEIRSCFQLKTLNLASNKLEKMSDALCTSLTSLNLSKYDFIVS
jgi:Leucine-rich repeat (LRR) protein